LRKKLRKDHLNDEKRRSVTRICEDYNNIFYIPGDRMTTSTAVEYVIPAPSIDPFRRIARRNYRIPEALIGELKQITEQMLEDKIIRHSTSPWNSPIILVRKKEDASGKQKWRSVVDFRKLKDVTVGDSFPYISFPRSWMRYAMHVTLQPLILPPDSIRCPLGRRTARRQRFRHRTAI
jgi:hypothetical protein